MVGKWSQFAHCSSQLCLNVVYDLPDLETPVLILGAYLELYVWPGPGWTLSKEVNCNEMRLNMDQL